MKNLAILVLISCFGWIGWQLFQNNFNVKSLVYNLPFTQKTVEIDLSDLDADITIPLNTGILKLRRGPWVEVFKKEKILQRNQFTIRSSNYPEKSWGRAKGGCPADAFAAAFYAFPGDVEPGSKHWDNNFGIQVVVLAADRKVRIAADQIREKDQIRVSGIQFKYDKEFKDGVEQIYQGPYTEKIFSLRLFYSTEI